LRNVSFFHRLLILGSVVVCLCPVPTAFAVAPRLATLLPTGAQRGAEVEVRFGGQRLDDTQEIVFYGPGIRAEKLDAGKTNLCKAMFRIAPDCALGEHPVRLRTATGVSEIRTFWVGPFPATNEVEPNSEMAKAQKISLNSTVAGTIASEDVDYFRVSAQAGQRLSVEIEAMRLGRGVFDASVAILDEDGKILAAADDSILALQDPIVSFLAPRTGDYLVQVRESLFGGRDDYQYRLHVGTFPRPTVVFPVSGRVGDKLTARFLGDPKGEFTQEFTLPATSQEKFGVFPVQEGVTAPSPNWLRVSTFPTMLETEPNDTREKAGAAPNAPVIFNGIISHPGDHDWFRFHARKGVNLQVTVFARRLRSPLDPAIQIVNAKGAAVAENDDAAGPDSTLTFKPDEDGDFAVLIRDHLKRGGPDFVYALEVAPVTPSLSLKIPDVARNDTQSRQYIAVPRGNRFATLVGIKRANLSGELVLHPGGLPDGVTMRAGPVAANVDAAAVVFEAAPDAPIGGKLLEFVMTATNQVEGRFRNDLDLVQGPNNSSYYGTRVDLLCVAVTEAAPFKLRIVEPKVPLVQGGAMDLQIEAQRDPGFDEPISVKLVWNPPGVSGQSDVIIPKGQTRVPYPLNAKADAETRAWKIAVLGSAPVKGGPLFLSSQLAAMEVATPYLTGKIQTTACQPGHRTNIVVQLDQKKPFSGEAIIKLLGLPEKAVVQERRITSADTEVVFTVVVDPKCPTGSHKNVFCSVAIGKDVEMIPHHIGAGGIFRVVPAKGVVKVAGK